MNTRLGILRSGLSEEELHLRSPDKILSGPIYHNKAEISGILHTVDVSNSPSAGTLVTTYLREREEITQNGM